MARTLLVGNSYLLKYCIALNTAGHTVDTILIARTRLQTPEIVKLLEYVQEVGIALYVRDGKDLECLANKKDIDVLVSAGWPFIIPDSILNSFSSALNVHPSLLPEYKGHLALWKMILDERDEAGLTVHFMTHEIDSGPIIVQERWPIEPFDTSNTLLAKFQQRGPAALVKALKILKSSDFQPKQQTSSGSYCRTLTDNSIFQLSLESTLQENLRVIRASMPPQFPAYIRHEGQTMNIAIWPDTSCFPNGSKTP